MTFAVFDPEENTEYVFAATVEPFTMDASATAGYVFPIVSVIVESPPGVERYSMVTTIKSPAWQLNPGVETGPPDVPLF
jgi:hypothetical protein